MRHLLLLALAAGLTGCDTGKETDSDTGTSPGTDLDGDGYTADVDCNDNDADINPGAAEVCDGADNNCDEVIDDTTTGGGTWYTDADGDTYGDPTKSTVACTAPSGTVADKTDCNDGNKDIHPGATEVCDANDVDEDCNGLADSADPSASGAGTWYADKDQDSFGDRSSSKLACEQPAGYVAEPEDCDDTDAAIHPGGTEICDGKDNDCNSKTDDEDPAVTGKSTWYADNDGDAYGTNAASLDACGQPAGYSASADDCNDRDGTVYPGAPEVCDGQDNDCNGLSDDADPQVQNTAWYDDLDQDGYGDGGTVQYACNAPVNTVADNTDCDDTNAQANPGGQEICDYNNVDEDCDGVADDNDLSVVDTSTFYNDADGDGFGDSSVSYTLCDALTGMVYDSSDCDDNDAAILGPTAWYVDADGDGYGDTSSSVYSCSQPSGYVSNGDDPLENGVLTTVSATADLTETTDVTANGSALYAVGFDADGNAGVFSVDPKTGAVTVLYSGDPLVQPTGIAVSYDGTTLYVTDAGAQDTSGLSGAVYSLSSVGGALSTLTLTGTVDTPTDVVVTYDDILYVSGKTQDETGAIFMQIGSSVTTYTSADLNEPMALAVSADGWELYVLDDALDGSRSEVLSLDASLRSGITVLAQNFQTAFPGGLAVSSDGAQVFYSAVGPARIYAVSTSSGHAESFALSGGVLPAGLSVYGSTLSIADLSAKADADIFSLSY